MEGTRSSTGVVGTPTTTAPLTSNNPGSFAPAPSTGRFPWSKCVMGCCEVKKGEEVILLDCFHVICSDGCVAKWLASFETGSDGQANHCCPTCSSRVSKNDLSKKVNLEEEFKEKVLPKEVVLICDNCVFDNVASSFCPKCPAYLCEECVLRHPQERITRFHVITTDLSGHKRVEDPNHCKGHPGEEFSHACVTCLTKLCGMCLEGHDEKHELIHIGKEKEKLQETIASSRQATEAAELIATELLKKREDIVQNQWNRILEEIDAQSKQMIEILLRRDRRLRLEAKKMFAEKMSELRSGEVVPKLIKSLAGEFAHTGEILLREMDDMAVVNFMRHAKGYIEGLPEVQNFLARDIASNIDRDCHFGLDLSANVLTQDMLLNCCKVKYFSRPNVPDVVTSNASSSGEQSRAPGVVEGVGQDEATLPPGTLPDILTVVNSTTGTASSAQAAPITTPKTNSDSDGQAISNITVIDLKKITEEEEESVDLESLAGLEEPTNTIMSTCGKKRLELLDEDVTVTIRDPKDEEESSEGIGSSTYNSNSQSSQGSVSGRKRKPEPEAGISAKFEDMRIIKSPGKVPKPNQNQPEVDEATTGILVITLDDDDEDEQPAGLEQELQEPQPPPTSVPEPGFPEAPLSSIEKPLTARGINMADYESANPDENHPHCFICMKYEGILACCEFCPKAYHFGCHIPTLHEIPAEDRWRCNFETTKTTTDALILQYPDSNENAELTEVNKPHFLLTSKLLMECYKLPETPMMRWKFPQGYLEKYGRVPFNLNYIKQRLCSGDPQRFGSVKEMMLAFKQMFTQAFMFFKDNNDDTRDLRDAKAYFDKFLFLVDECYPEHAEVFDDLS